MNSFLTPKTNNLKKTFYPKQLRIKKYTDNLIFGDFGIKLQEPVCIKVAQLESLLKNINKKLKKIGKVWIRPFPHFFLTKKPLEVRMGNGKGNFFSWAINLPRGAVIAEFSFNNNSLAVTESLSIFKNLRSKIPVFCKLIKKNDLY